MNEPAKLLTLAELATHFGCSGRKLRRLLPRVPGLSPIRCGSAMLFTSRDVDLITEAMRCPFTSAAAATFGTPGARSVSVAKSSKSQNSAQDAIRALTQKSKSNVAPRIRADHTSPGELTGDAQCPAPLITYSTK
jgi:AraC-like DNA-binding protein